METRCFIHRRTLFRAIVIVFLATLAIDRLSAQTTESPQGQSVQSKSIPADHYDPDDVKTYSDVIVEDRNIPVRDKQLLVHFYRPQTAGPATPAIYACGDGGWRGLAPRTAEQLAHDGLAVAGIDSKVYLREFSSSQDPLTLTTLANDYADIAKALRVYASVDSNTPVLIYGWSLGAGFAVAVGSEPSTRQNWAGIISIGLPKQNQLVSGVGGNYLNLKVGNNTAFGFRSEAVMASIAPLPLVMIQSTSDTASPPRVGRELFAAARDPKQYILINSTNHRFSGAREEFYSALANAVSWTREASKSAKGNSSSTNSHE
jgi:dienelactone hydrolase